MASKALEAAVQAVVDWNASLDMQAPIADMRKSYDDFMNRAAPLPADIRCEEIDINGIPAEWVSAPGVKLDRAILFFHGGGYLVGSKKALREFVGRLSRACGSRVLSIDYRLSPEHPYPAALEDAVTAYHWLLGQGIDPANIAVGGESAGGGLALAMMMDLRGARVSLPACAALISPFADMSVSGDSAKPGAVNDPTVAAATLQFMASCYIGEDTKNPGASPLFGDARGLPPLLLMAGEREVLRDDAVRLAQWARSAGVEAELFTSPEMAHIWPVIAPTAPEAAEAVERIRRFFSTHGVA